MKNAEMSTPKPKIAPIEGHFLIGCGYGDFIALPMSLASAVLPHIKHVFKLEREAPSDTPVLLLSSEEVTTLIVAERLTREE